METFDNEEFEQQPEAPQEPQVTPSQTESAYHSNDTGRKESPFADSPYVNQAQREYEYQPQSQPPRSLKSPNPALLPVSGFCPLFWSSPWWPPAAVSQLPL